MTVRYLGALLCAGALLFAPMPVAMAQSASISTSHSNVKSPPECKKAGGEWNKKTKTCGEKKPKGAAK